MSEEIPEWIGDSTVEILLLDPSGILYENQTGGYACRHPNERGHILKIDPPDELADDLMDFFCSEHWNGWCSEGIDHNGEEACEATIAFIEKALAFADFKVDRARLSESQEAWVYGFHKGKPALLAWPNSD